MANRLGGAAGGAAGGALAGAPLGPWGVAGGALIGGTLGFLGGGDSGKGYETAAQGAQAASNGYNDLANWQWDTSMQGLDKAQAAYGGSNQLWNNTYGNQGSNAMADWWTKNQNAFSQPTAARSAMDDYSQYMQQPSNAQGAYQNAQGSMGYSASQDYNNRFGGQMQQRSAAENAYNPANYQSPGAAESFYGQAQGMLGGPGRAEQLQYQNTSNMGNFAAGLAAQQGQGATTAGASEIGGYYRGANDVSQYAGSQMGQLGGPGAYEQFVTSDINGTNPQLQRETDQGLARINQEMARRGGFHSGGADTQIGNFLGEEAAKDYQNRAERAQSAQQMQLGRIGAGQSLSQASAQGKLAQGSSLQSLAGQTDAEKMSRLSQQMAAQQGASSEGLANSQQRLGYAQAGDQGNLARAQALGGFANSAQSAELARLSGGMGAAGQSDMGLLNRMQQGQSMAHSSDADNLARNQGLYGMSQGLDAANMNRYQTQFNMGQGVDQGDLARLLGAGGMAGNVTSANQQQLNDMFRSRFGLDQASSGNIADFYKTGMQGYGTEQGNSLNAMANAYGLLGQAQGADAAYPMQMLGLGIDTLGALNGKKRG